MRMKSRRRRTLDRSSTPTATRTRTTRLSRRTRLLRPRRRRRSARSRLCRREMDADACFLAVSHPQDHVRRVEQEEEVRALEGDSLVDERRRRRFILHSHSLSHDQRPHVSRRNEQSWELGADPLPETTNLSPSPIAAGQPSPSEQSVQQCQCSYSFQARPHPYFCANRNWSEKVLVSWSQCSQLIPSVPACATR